MARGLFRRRRHEAAGETPVAAPEPVSRPAGTDGGWHAVRPLSTTVQRLSTMSDGLRFRDGLAAWQDPSQRIELGHAVSAEAPTGMGTGLVRTVGRSAHAPRPGLPRPLVHRVPPGPDDAGQPEPEPETPSRVSKQGLAPMPITEHAPVVAGRDTAPTAESFVDTLGRPAGPARPSIPRGRLTVARAVAPPRRLPLAASRPARAPIVADRPPLGTWTTGQPSAAEHRASSAPSEPAAPVRPGQDPALPVAAGPAADAPPDPARAAVPPGAAPVPPVRDSGASASPAPAEQASIQRSATASGSPAPGATTPDSARRPAGPVIQRSTSDSASASGGARSSRSAPGIGAPLPALPSTARFIAGDRSPDEPATPSRPLLPDADAIQRLIDANPAATNPGAATPSSAPGGAPLPVVSGDRDTPAEPVSAPPPAREAAAPEPTPVQRAAKPSTVEGPRRPALGEPLSALPPTAGTPRSEPRARPEAGSAPQEQPTTGNRPLLPESTSIQRLPAHPGSGVHGGTGDAPTAAGSGALPVVAGQQDTPAGTTGTGAGSPGAASAVTTPVRVEPGAPGHRGAPPATGGGPITIARAAVAEVRVRGLLPERPLVPEFGQVGGTEPTAIGPRPSTTDRPRVVTAKWAAAEGTAPGGAGPDVTGSVGSAASGRGGSGASGGVGSGASGTGRVARSAAPGRSSTSDGVRPVQRVVAESRGTTVPRQGSVAHLPASPPNWPSRRGAVLAENPVPGGPVPARPPVVAAPAAKAHSDAPPVPVRRAPTAPQAAAPAAVSSVQRSASSFFSSLFSSSGGGSASSSGSGAGSSAPEDMVGVSATTTAKKESHGDKVPAKPEAGPGPDAQARQIADAVMRLLRAELRFGKERSGRLHERRR